MYLCDGFSYGTCFNPEKTNRKEIPTLVIPVTGSDLVLIDIKGRDSEE